MGEFVAIIVAAVAGVGASSGFWSYVIRKDSMRDAHTSLLLGIAHDRIIHLGMTYIERGWIGKDEYEDFHKYLFDPYSKFGGNGLAERVMKEVDQLPMKGRVRVPVEAKSEQFNNAAT